MNGDSVDEFDGRDIRDIALVVFPGALSSIGHSVPFSIPPEYWGEVIKTLIL